MKVNPDVGDNVRVEVKLGRIDKVIRLNYRRNYTVVKVAFGKGPAKDFVSPPTKIGMVS